MIRKATPADIDAITAIYDAVLDAEDAGIVTTGWCRNVYPVRSTAEASVQRGDMFVLEEDGTIIVTGMINQVQSPQYAHCSWRHKVPDEEIMVLHTLAVHPDYLKKGYGSRFMEFYENYALEHQCRYLRIDTQEKNIGARAVYRKLGYTEQGVVFDTFNGIPNVRLVCLEKKL